MYLLERIISRSGRENTGICYVNHMLRESAFREEEMVRRVARERGIYYCIVRARVRELAKDRGWSIEEAGRKIRYRILEKIASRRGFDYIATGHNLNDAFETFIMNSIRGSGVMGLIIPPRRGKIIRPLILMEKEKILKYLEKHGIPFSMDETNLQDDFSRNFIRNQVEVKILERFPHALRGFRRTYVNLVGEYRFTLRNLKSLFRRSLLFRRRRFYIFDADILLLEDKHLVSTLFSRMVPNITQEHIGSIMEILSSGGKVNVPGNIFFHSQYGLLSIYRNPLEMYGTFFLYPGRGLLHLSDIARIKYRISREPVKGPHFMSIPLDKVSFPLKIRGRRQGDRIGRKKLKDAFVDSKIPAFLRDAIPVVESMGEIIFVPGVYKKQFYPFRDSAYLVIEIEGFVRRFMQR